MLLLNILRGKTALSLASAIQFFGVGWNDSNCGDLLKFGFDEKNDDNQNILLVSCWSNECGKAPNSTNQLSVKWTPHPISNFDGYKYKCTFENTNTKNTITAVFTYRQQMGTKTI